MKTVKGPLFLALLLAATSAPADTIEYTVENVLGDRWQYNYTLTNNGASEVDLFSVFFDAGLYENLAVVASPLGWDSVALQPDAGLPADGLFDSFAFGAPLVPGATLTGFSVAFDFLGQGTPGEQFFEMYNTFVAGFDPVFDGLTILVEPPVTPVPLPPTLWLFALGLVGMLLRRRQQPTDT